MSLIKQIAEDPGYFAERNGMYGLGKWVAHSVAEVTPNMVTQVSAGAAGFLGESLVGLTTVGLTAGVSAGLVQVDYYHKRNNLKEAYKEELAAKLKKPVGKITVSDLDTIAKGDPAKGIGGNRALDEELRKSKRERNFGVVFSFVATMTALAAVFFLVPAAAAYLGVALPKATSLFNLASYTMPKLASLAVNVAVGITTYNAVKMPLHWLGDKLFGLDEKTTHDRIDSLKKDREAGKVISREQVLSVFVSANQQLDHFIAAQYGQPFEKLDIETKQTAVDNLEKLIPLERLTSDINSGKINPTELAFAVDGQISGVEHPEGHRHEKHNMWMKIRSAFNFKSHAKTEVGALAIQTPEVSAAMAYAEEKPGKSFVQRLGRSKLEPSMGYVKQLEQQAANTPLSQTIH